MAKLEKTLVEIAEIAGGGSIVGESDFFCSRVAPLEEAEADELSFVRDRKSLADARKTRAGALVVAEELPDFGGQQLVVEDPFAAMIAVLQIVAIEKRRQPVGVDPLARIEEGVELGQDVIVGAGAVIRSGAKIGDRAVIHPQVHVGFRSVIGEESVIHPQVVIMEDVTIGRHVVVHGGTVIGCDGYGYVPAEGRQVKVPQVGEVVVGDDVEVGALVTIDRATIGATVIGRGTKIGDLVHVAHNCRIGEDVLLLPTAAVSGSVTVGDRAIFAGRAGCAGHLTIGEDARLGATSVAYKDVPPGAVLWGNPAKEKTHEMRVQLLLARLPEIYRELQSLKERVGSG
jgi:UDP-3-O-[3-hydroxymyristoyl] glucosamine N-acyltransferase